MLTVDEVVEILDGVDLKEFYKKLRNMSSELCKANIVVASGYSDDILVFEGRVSEEFYGESDVFVARLYPATLEPYYPECTCEDCPHEERILREATFETVTARFAPEDGDSSWVVTASFPHSKFNIMEDGFVFCEAIVFKLRI